ncbi:uncharacterized protein RHOBADRAFT_44154 [Rhodotorula graminis WP1]|uniref:holo-[acyl-carrier-protein] synthase n=1 Tax=Rhodotorula graminis (strain WP1) TaxID=578459 RepID=A0A194S293_RHOGW|nr:uncharacterized protein RHOBADRAFT_44154 [Rhodotorula graminis WP1]KPV74640.1 hypothetical protein RHOBADRAFT_44154 [Rhodotorula graminis WP1]
MPLFLPHDTALNDHSLDTLIDLVDPESRVDVRKFRFLRDARRCICGRLLALHVASTRLDQPWTALSFRKSERGRPYLERSEPPEHAYDYNTSHDGELVAVVSVLEPRPASTSPFPGSTAPSPRVGVDVMRIRNPWDGTSVDEFVSGVAEQLAPRELSALSRFGAGPGSDARRLRHVLALWTLKEAFVKATGEGLHRDLRSVSFKLKLDAGMGESGEGHEARRVGEGTLEGRKMDGWRFSLVEVGEDAGSSEAHEQQTYWLAVTEQATGGNGDVSLALRRPEWVREVALAEIVALARDDAF